MQLLHYSNTPALQPHMYSLPETIDEEVISPVVAGRLFFNFGEM